MIETFALVVVGGGLTAHSALRARIATGPTLVLEYQEVTGGLLRPCLPAAQFADEWALVRAGEIPDGVTVRAGTTAVGLIPAPGPGRPHTLLVRSRDGTEQVRTGRVLLACGGLELPRERDRIAGTRPSGILTPYAVHQLLARGYLPGHTCVVYGAGRYALATAQRLAAAGARVTLLPPAGRKAPPAPSGVSLAPPGAIVELGGFPRLEWLTVRRNGDDEVRADLLVYAAGLLANTHWLKGSDVQLDEHGAVRVDAAFRTGIPGIYAAGTVVAPDIDHPRSLAMGVEVARAMREDRA